MAVERDALIRVNLDVDGLTDPHRTHLGLFEVRRDVDFVRNQRHQRNAGVDRLTDFGALLADVSVDGRRNPRVREALLGQVQLGFGRLDLARIRGLFEFALRRRQTALGGRNRRRRRRHSLLRGRYAGLSHPDLIARPLQLRRCLRRFRANGVELLAGDVAGADERPRPREIGLCLHVRLLGSRKLGTRHG